MEELKERLALSDEIISRARSDGASLVHYEHLALQFRKMLELIAFSSLAANKEKYALVHEKFSTHWNAKKLLKNIEEINEDFYPKPIALVRDLDNGQINFEYVYEDHLTQDDFIELYQRASSALHVPNPFRKSDEWNFGLPVDTWMNKIIMLMRLHQIRLVDSDMSWIVMLASEEHAKASLLAAVQIDGA